MNVKEIKELISRDLDRVFAILDEVFMNNSMYNDLCREYISKPNNFDKADFRSRLNRLVNIEKKTIESMLDGLKIDSESEEEENQSEDDINKSDEEYNLVRKLNFTLPLERFRDLSDSSKVLLPFIIRGEGSYGQKWLYHKLVYDYFERIGTFVKPLVIDFKQRNITTFENLLDELCEEFKVEYKSKTTSKKKSIVKKYLLDKMETTSQILIFNEACNSLANEFEAFYEILVFISDEMEVNELSNTKCILLLVESEKDQLIGHEDKFVFLSKTTASYKAKMIKELRFIDLDLISPITKICIETWLGKLPPHILDCIDCDDEYIEKLINDCDNGHPDKVIPEVCKLINIDFEQKKNLWLTF